MLTGKEPSRALVFQQGIYAAVFISLWLFVTFIGTLTKKQYDNSVFGGGITTARSK